MLSLEVIPTTAQCTIAVLHYTTGLCDSPDYSMGPSESVQKTWIRYYLKECARIRGTEVTLKWKWNELIKQKWNGIH